MELKRLIDKDLKSALLTGDKSLATTLRGLKSAILNAEIAVGKRQEGLDEDEIIAVLRKEDKKRQESAELFSRGGNSEKAQAELAESEIISKYLPKQLSDEQLEQLVDTAIQEIVDTTPQAMGKVIARVKGLSNGQADGGRIAQVVKRKLQIG